MKQAFTSAIRILCFLAVLALVLLSLDHMLAPKNDDGIYDMELFYELPEDSVEVLFLGSSHAYCGFNTGVLWQEYGLPSYVLAGSQQPMWNSYYCLLEALKTQRPGLVVLEGYMTYIDTPYRDDSMVIRNTYGMRWSKTRVEAIRASAPEETWKSFLPAFVQYHTRYRDLTFADVLPYQGDVMYEHWKGTTLKFHTEEKETPQVADVDGRERLQERTEEYYRKILALCVREDIPLLVVVTPYVTTPEKQLRFNEASAIAAEYGVPFVDYNRQYEEIGMDFLTDMADDGHLNAEGGAKFTRALGAYIREHYGLPDWRLTTPVSWDPVKAATIRAAWDADADYIYERLRKGE